MDHHEVWSELEAYLDGELPAEERWAMAAHLNGCLECRQRLANLMKMRELVRERLGAVEAPPGLEDRLRSVLAAEPAPPVRLEGVANWTRPELLRLVAALVLLAAGLAFVARWLAPVTAVPVSLRTEITLAHALFAQDRSKLDVVGGPAEVAAWFHDEAGFTVSIPRFPGYSLSGARLVVINGQAAAQLVYQRDTDRAYLSFMRFKDRGADLAGMERVNDYAISRQGETSLITWRRGGDRLVLAGEVSEPEIRKLADDLAAQPDPTAIVPVGTDGTPRATPGAGSRADDW